MCTSDSERQITMTFVSLVGLKVGKKRKLNAMLNAKEGSPIISKSSQKTKGTIEFRKDRGDQFALGDEERRKE